MLIEKNSKIGDVVAYNFRTVEVFENYGLDFCCGGKKTIEKACAEKGLNAEEVISNLATVKNGNGAANQNFSEWTLSFLIDYIINVHHSYVANNMPRIFEHAKKVATVHGDNHPEVVQVFNLFSELSQDLEMHMMKEEKMLFPYIKRMEAMKQSGSASEHPPFGSVANPIKMMEMEHETAGAILANIREISNDLVPPEDACGTYRVLYKEIDDFEKDLHRHIHLENNILHPKATMMESGLIYKQN